MQLSLLILRLWLPLAQATPWDDAPKNATPAPPARPMSINDLNDGFRAYNNGETGNGFRNGILIVLVLVGVIALLLHFRQRHKSAGPPDSLHKLGFELARCVHFPFFSRFLLYWVAHSTKTPFPSLLLSASLFDKSVDLWSQHATFHLVRRWGRTRLERLRPELFA